MITKRIILSAGHGGIDGGGSGQGVSEYSQNVEMVNKTADLLRADGQLEVVVVPQELTLDPAISWVNARYKNIDDAIAIEVHKNDISNTAVRGLETWFYGDATGPDATSKALAEKLHSKLIAITGLVNRGVKPSNTAPQGGLGWVDRTNTWALLPEMGFIDSDPLDNVLYSKALFEGILNLWGLVPKPATPPPPPVDPCANIKTELANTKAELAQARADFQKQEVIVQNLNGDLTQLRKDKQDLVLTNEALVIEVGNLTDELAEAQKPHTVTWSSIWADIKSMFKTKE